MTELETRWATNELVGDAKHALIVRVRPGYMHRAFQDCNRIDTGGPVLVPLLWKAENHSPWQGLWTPTAAWQELPNIISETHARDFDPLTGGQRGSSTCTVVMANEAWVDVTAEAGLYHDFARGFYSPMRGTVPSGRTDLWPDDATNAWSQALNSGWQIEIWQGYGQGADVQLRTSLVDHSYAPASGAIHRTWTGIITGCDMESNPDKITITARDFGIFLTDQRPIGDNKSPDIRSPVTFADRNQTQGETKIVSPLTTSDGTPTFVDPTWSWQSAAKTATTDHAWIEVTMVAGYYTDLFLASQFDGEDVYVSLWMNGTGGVLDSTHPQPAGWVDVGLGNDPNGNPYVHLMSGVVAHPSQRWGIYPGHAFDVPDGSKLRLTFTSLTTDGTANYYAGTRDFAVYRYGSDPSAGPGPGVNAKGWILIQDVIDVVRVVLIWAGFKEWQLETFGWTLYKPRSYGGDKSFMDMIDDVLQEGDFVFYMAPPTDDDRSIGVPCCVHSSATDAPGGGMLTLRDQDFSQALQTTWDDSDLPYVMRYRGAVSAAGQLLISEGNDITLTTPRFMATYYPPWAGSDQARLGTYVYSSGTQIRRTAAVLRHFTETMGQTVVSALTSNEECMLACILAAIQYALRIWTGSVQIAGRTGIELNGQVAIEDEAQAVNSRMWVTSIQSQHQMGANGKWTMTIGGVLIDTAEMASIITDYNHWLPLASAKRRGF